MWSETVFVSIRLSLNCETQSFDLCKLSPNWSIRETSLIEQSTVEANVLGKLDLKNNLQTRPYKCPPSGYKQRINLLTQMWFNQYKMSVCPCSLQVPRNNTSQCCCVPKKKGRATLAACPVAVHNSNQQIWVKPGQVSSRNRKPSRGRSSSSTPVWIKSFTWHNQLDFFLSALLKYN